MAEDEFTKFLSSIVSKTTIIALDLGEKTIGVAVSDLNWMVATPLKTILRKKFSQDSSEILELSKERQIGGIVIGLPKHMNGSEGRRCQSTRAFAKNLTQKTSLPILLCDERLSTVAAEKALIQGNTSRLKRSKIIDHVAAAYILQGVLDRMAYVKKSFDD